MADIIIADEPPKGRCSIHGPKQPVTLSYAGVDAVSVPLKGCPDCFIDFMREMFAEFMARRGREWTTPEEADHG